MAVHAAKKGRDTWTNPQVGAVIVKNDHVLAVGYHHQYGQKHAEIDALSHLADVTQASGATMYVTLEPCSHYGKTPPCAKRLCEVNISRVIIGQLDPNPLVSGKGVEMLERNGVEVIVLNDEAGLNEAYNFYYRRHRPFVTMKYAMSLDGKINGADDTRTQLTHTPAQQDVQKIRRHQQAILVGAQTLAIDNPHLTVRDDPKMAFPPIRIALIKDANAVQSNVHLMDSAAPTWLFSQHNASGNLPDNVKVIVAGEWTPESIIRYLASHGVQSLLVEGGSAVQAAFIASGLVDRLIVYLVPTLIGGTGLPAAVGVPLENKAEFATPVVTQLGPDVRIEARRV